MTGSPRGCSGVVNFVHPLRAAHASPSLREGEVDAACFVFLWVPASAGMTDRRVKSPGRYLTRSFGVNDLGFAPPPNFGGGYVDRFYELVCYQQSNAGALLREEDSARIWSRKETDAGTPAKIFRTRCEIPTSTTCPSPLVKVVVTITRLDPSSRRRRSLATKRD